MMNFDFTPEQEMLRSTVRKFVDKEIMPYIKEWDERGYFDPNISPKIKKSFLIIIKIFEFFKT